MPSQDPPRPPEDHSWVQPGLPGAPPATTFHFEKNTDSVIFCFQSGQGERKETGAGPQEPSGVRSGRAPHPGAGGGTSVPALPCPAFLLMQGRGSGGAPAGSGEGRLGRGQRFQLHTPPRAQGLGKASQPRDSPWPLQGDKAQSRLRSEERGSSHAQGREERAEGSEIPPRTRPQPLTCSGEAARGTGEGTVFSGFPVGKARGLPPAAEPPWREE